MEVEIDGVQQLSVECGGWEGGQEAHAMAERRERGAELLTAGAVPRDDLVKAGQAGDDVVHGLAGNFKAVEPGRRDGASGSDMAEQREHRRGSPDFRRFEELQRGQGTDDVADCTGPDGEAAQRYSMSNESLTSTVFGGRHILSLQAW